MSLINKSEVKKVALEKARYKYRNIPVYMPTQVSNKFIMAAEDALNLWINTFIANRPTKGKTL